MISPSKDPYSTAQMLASRFKNGEEIPLSELIAFLTAADIRATTERTERNKPANKSEDEIDFF